MKKKNNLTNILLVIFTVLCLIIIGIQYTTLEDPVRDYFAETVTTTETVWINTTLTEYIPYWINTTEYIPYWNNNTIWINDTIWINNTEYVPYWINSTIWINSTTFVDYPFVLGWNTSSPISPNYIHGYKSGTNLYRFDFYNQIEESLFGFSYTNYNNCLFTLQTHLASGALSVQQYDCAFIQLKILQLA